MSLRVLLPGSTIPSKLLKVVPTQLGSEVVSELGGRNAGRSPMTFKNGFGGTPPVA